MGKRIIRMTAPFAIHIHSIDNETANWTIFKTLGINKLPSKVNRKIVGSMYKRIHSNVEQSQIVSGPNWMNSMDVNIIRVRSHIEL